MADRLLEVDRVQRRVGTTTALVHVPADRCPRCEAPAEITTIVVEALFVHGGYGAARREVRRWCSALCGWHIQSESTEQRPAWRS